MNPKRERLGRQIEAILPQVERPTRYLGNELNTISKPDSEVEVRWALIFPEVYEVGMSWPGQQILYNLLNSREGILAERCYAYWPDMEAKMRAAGVPSYSLESWTPLGEFDILGITLQYELVFTNILAMLDMAGIPLAAAERRDTDPIIIAGGPVAYNAEPIADFLDAVALGDGEDLILEVGEVVKEWKREGRAGGRVEVLRRLGKLRGVYVPRFYEISYHAEAVEGWNTSAIAAITPRDGAPAKVRRRWVEDLNRVPFPEKPIVPLGDVVHNRLGIEVQRGCTRACRFCQAGYIYRPERQRDPEKVKELVAKSLQSTGYDEVSLLSLSIGDYGCLDSLLGDLLGETPRGTSNLSVSLPSIRADTLIAPVVDKIRSARKTGFTVAPEAGSQRLRDVINKPLSEEQIANAAELVFQRGWDHIKFYYMVGIPTETDDDVMGIVRTARMCQEIGRKYTRKADIIVSTSTFIPKPFTPFQWEPQIPRDEILRKQEMLKYELKKTNLTYRWHESRESFLEAVLSRGDRRLSAVVLHAFRAGARFDGWKEHFREDVWREAFAACGVEPGFYAHRRIPVEEVLPWDHIDAGPTKEWLAKDYLNGVKAKFVPDCATGRCYDCGVCDFEVVKNRTYVNKVTQYFPQGMKPRGHGAHPQEISLEGGVKLADLVPAAPFVSNADSVRYRVKFEKKGRGAWLSHLDLMETLSRSFRRAKVRIAYSEGFRPKPRMSFGPALMMGASTLDEYFDVDLLPPLPEPDWIALVNAGLPTGLRLLEAVEIAKSAASLGARTTGAVFQVTERLEGTLPADDVLRERISAFIAAASVMVETPKRAYDVRPVVRRAELVAPRTLELDIAYSASGSAKPSDVLRAMFGWTERRSADSLQITKLITTFAPATDCPAVAAHDAHCEDALGAAATTSAAGEQENGC